MPEVVDEGVRRTRGLREQLHHASSDDDADKQKDVAEIIKAALMAGEITAFAVDPIAGRAFAISPYAWGPVPLSHYDAYASIEEGVFLVDGNAYPDRSPDRLLAGVPLFVDQKEINGWWKLRPPSKSSLMRRPRI